MLKYLPLLIYPECFQRDNFQSKQYVNNEQSIFTFDFINIPQTVYFYLSFL